MQRALEEFVLALRGSGLEPGLSECVDAYRAARIVGLDDRDGLREALGATLAKTEPGRAIFDDVFERYFSFTMFDEPLPGASESDPGADDVAARPPTDARTPTDILLRMIETTDRAGLAGRLRAAEQQVGITRAWLPTQRGLYTRRMLEAMGGDGLIAEEHALGSLSSPSAATALRISRLRAARERLFEEVRDHVSRRLVLYGKSATEKLRDTALSTQRLSNIERRDFDRMLRLIHKLARRLATRHALRQRRQRRGVLDVRRTLARNVAYGGVLFETRWKHRPISKPKVIAICDVSRSVASYARFLLLLLYGLRDVLPDVRSFAFTHRLVDVSGYFDRDPPHIAIERVLDQVGGTGTNYGTMLRDFAQQELPKVDRRTAVIILGDGRNNRAEPEVAVMRELHKRARRVVWLNPEPRSFWALGDSEMPRYAPCCHTVRECGTLVQLERAVDSLLRSTGSNG
ncbi:VWA domain-containing protein [Nevskia sp.]|uniref:VWA domain-containing protein n=1 Tax=Nevskia sp. TaxID=1929292 RepID=UPI0025E6B1FE|nr:VWA domain-containing protein [Nevskia sp.]